MLLAGRFVFLVRCCCLAVVWVLNPFLFRLARRHTFVYDLLGCCVACLMTVLALVCSRHDTTCPGTANCGSNGSPTWCVTNFGLFGVLADTPVCQVDELRL